MSADNCTARKRRSAEQLAASLERLADVTATDALAPARGVRQDWTVEIVVSEPSVPPHVLRELGDAGATLHLSTTQGARHHIVLVTP